MRKIFSLVCAVFMTVMMFGQSYGILVNGHTYFAGTPAGEYEGFTQYTAHVQINAGDYCQLYYASSGATWAVKLNTYSEDGFTLNEDRYEVSVTGCYDFYIKLKYGADELYIGNGKDCGEGEEIGGGEGGEETFVGFDASTKALGEQIEAGLAKNQVNVNFVETSTGKYSINLVEGGVEGSFSFGGVIFAYKNSNAGTTAWKTYGTYIQPNGKDREVRIPLKAGEKANVILVEACTGVLVNGESVDFEAGDNILTASAAGLVLKSASTKPKIQAILPVEGGDEPIVDTKYYMKNNWDAGSDWFWKEMSKDGEVYKLENVVFGGTGVNFNTAESDEGATWKALEEISGDAIEAKDTVTFVLNPAAGEVSATLVGKYQEGGDEPIVDTKYYMKNNWDAGSDWFWKEMSKDGEVYKLENVVFGGTGVNFNTAESDEGATWKALEEISGDAIEAKDTVTFVLNPAAGEVSATLVGKYQEGGDEPIVDTKYFMKNNWDAGSDWFWKEMSKDGEVYKLENVVFGGTGVNFNTAESDEGATWKALEEISGDAIEAKDTVTFVLNPAAGEVSATLVGKYQEGGDEPIVDTKYFMKNNWDAGSDWFWKEMSKDGEVYKLANVVFGGTGVNFNTAESDEGATWKALEEISGDAIEAKDTVTFVLNPVAGEVSATLVGKYQEGGDEPGEKIENPIFTVIVPEGTDSVFVAGSFDEWASFRKLSAVEGKDNQFTIQIEGEFEAIEYKYLAGPDWKYVEVREGDANRTFVVDALDEVSAWTSVPEGGEEPPTPGKEGYALLVNGTDLIDLTHGEEYEGYDQWFVEGAALKAGDVVKVHSYETEASWAIGILNPASSKHVVNSEEGLVFDQDGEYTIYLKLKFEADEIYVAPLADEGGDEPVADGFYLIGTFNDWTPSAQYAFVLNPEAAPAVEYKVSVDLQEGDKLKGLAVIMGQWIYYPEGDDIVVPAEYAGNCTIYFRPEYNAEWAAFGGHIYIEKQQGQGIDAILSEGKAVKVLHEGKLLIMKGSHSYTPMGQIVK